MSECIKPLHFCGIISPSEPGYMGVGGTTIIRTTWVQEILNIMTFFHKIIPIISVRKVGTNFLCEYSAEFAYFFPPGQLFKLTIIRK